MTAATSKQVMISITEIPSLILH